MSESGIVSVRKVGSVAIISVNSPPVNTITAVVRSALNEALDGLAHLSGIKAALLICEGSTFFSGADIGEFSGPPMEHEYRNLFARIEQLPVPVVAAMHGTVLGGGLEITLACHYRVAAPGTRFGLPEVTLGIIPGAGGTQRMPRLIGVEKTLDLIIDAKPVDTRTALEWGFLDAELSGDLLQGAIIYAEQLIVDGKGPRRTCDFAVNPSSCSDAILDRLSAQATKQYPNRIAPFTAIKAVRSSLTMPFEQGLSFETELVNQAKLTDESKGSVHAFFAERETRRIPDLPADIKARPIKRAGVIGAGTMGGGIAICFANAGIPVTLLDASREGLDRGIAGVDRTYESMVKRGRLTAAEKAQRMSLITGSLDYADLKDANVVIEAVFENMALKQQIFSKLDQVTQPGTLLASNTSTLDIDEIGKVTSRPGDVIGLHFFSPANVMPLLEVVRTDASSAATIRTAMDLSRPLRKTPVLSRVCYGFIGNRMMEGYAREAERMLLEGATPRDVDSVLEEWGMAMGILAVFDLAGVDIGVKIHEANAERFPPDPVYYQAERAIYEAGRLGQKNGKGFYRYEAGDRARHDDPEAVSLLKAKADKLGVAARSHSRTEILERCLYPLLNEGIRILEEGVAIRAGDVDVVWTAGYGFPRYRGGPMFYADTIGLKTLLDGMLKYQKLFGPMHWQPANLLVELVEKGQTLADWQRAKH